MSLRNRRQQRNRRPARRRSLSQTRRPLMERLEDRRLLTVVTPTLGASNDVVFSGDGDVDSIQLGVAGSGSAGLLYHNLGGRFGFNSGLDLDAPFELPCAEAADAAAGIPGQHSTAVFEPATLRLAPASALVHFNKVPDAEVLVAFVGRYRAELHLACQVWGGGLPCRTWICTF